MKKVLFILTTVICMFFCISVHAEGNVMKISMDGTVKQAKEIGGGKGISFTLPELDEADYYIYAIELAVFEKQDGESQWHIYQDDNGEETKKQYIESPDIIGRMKRHLTNIDEHLRTMIRVIIWKQWKVPSKREWGLKKLGVNKNLARLTAYCGNRYQWVVTKTCVVRAISKEKLTKKGLVSCIDYYNSRRHNLGLN